MAGAQTVPVRCLSGGFAWRGHATSAGQVIEVPPHVAQAMAQAGRVAYLNDADRDERTQATTPARIAIGGAQHG